MPSHQIYKNSDNQSLASIATVVAVSMLGAGAIYLFYAKSVGAFPFEPTIDYERHLVNAAAASD